MSKKNQAEYEWVPVGERASFAVREFRLPCFTSPWHLHQEIELTLILAGAGTRFVGDSIATFHPGDLVLIGANTPHYWRSKPRPAGFSHSIVIQFRADCLGADFFRRPEMLAVQNLLVRARRGLAFPAGVRNDIESRMAALLTQSGAERVASFVAVLARLAEARGGKVLSGESFFSATDFSGHNRIHRACRHVFEHLSDPIRLVDAAWAAALTPEALCRLFRRVTGKTFFEFVNDARIGHACMQLIETDGRIGEIALDSGFNTLANFNRRFRERKQMTPKEYRAQFRKADARAPGEEYG